MIPDAPYIRDAQLNGLDLEDDYVEDDTEFWGCWWLHEKPEE